MSPIIVPELSDTLNFQSSAALDAAVSVEGSWKAFASFIVAGIFVDTSGKNSLYYVQRYAGEKDVPSDVRRLRKSTLETMRRMGQPVIVKHMFNDHDAKIGTAKASPVFDPTYGQTRNKDPFSYGTGFSSIQLSDDEWINPTTGAIVTSDTSPGKTFIQAPKYRGYGPGFLTYIIEPDVPLDLFKLNATGALIKTQSQTVVSAWFPEINDNDLLINVELDNDGNVVDTHERYQAKISRPITIRGLDRKGRREYSSDHGNRHVINQNFEMALVPETSILMQVETDR